MSAPSKRSRLATNSLEATSSSAARTRVNTIRLSTWSSPGLPRPAVWFTCQTKEKRVGTALHLPLLMDFAPGVFNLPSVTLRQSTAKISRPRLPARETPVWTWPGWSRSIILKCRIGGRPSISSSTNCPGLLSLESTFVEPDRTIDCLSKALGARMRAECQSSELILSVRLTG